MEKAIVASLSTFCCLYNLTSIIAVGFSKYSTNMHALCTCKTQSEFQLIYRDRTQLGQILKESNFTNNVSTATQPAKPDHCLIMHDDIMTRRISPSGTAQSSNLVLICKALRSWFVPDQCFQDNPYVNVQIHLHQKHSSLNLLAATGSSRLGIFRVKPYMKLFSFPS